MFVFVSISDVDLTRSAYRTISEEFCQHANFKAPIRRNPVDSCQIDIHSELAGQRIPKAIEELQKRCAGHHPFHGAYQRCHEERCDAAMHPIGYSCAEAFTEFEFEVEDAQSDSTGARAFAGRS
jgi:hypothetical protein